MSPDEPWCDRIDELLVDRALQGLTAGELDELGGLLADFEAEGLAFELAAAEAALTLDPPPFEALPDSLHRKVEVDAEAHFTQIPLGYTRRGVAARVIPWLGWIAAAASLLYTMSLPHEIPVLPDRVRTPSIAERLAGVPSRALTHTNHPLAKESGGSLVWNSQRQEGYLEIQGLAEVDPGQGIYQLWIFDASRDERFPIDGGTFAVANSRITTVVPIHPAIQVREPTLFAITLEPPGGVVVSDRKRILLTARY